MKDWTTMARRDFDCGAPEGQQLAAFPQPDECGTPDMFGCDGDGKCTNPRCPVHGIEWSA